MYFKWLQKDCPSGNVDILPELDDNYETSVPGIFCIGDLTGIPLIKLAAESGFDIIEYLSKEYESSKSEEVSQSCDFIIVGAGPAGISAAIQAQKKGYSVKVFESSESFNTIKNFPMGKPIYVTPESPPAKSDLKFSNGTRETLLQELKETLRKLKNPVNDGEMVTNINGEKGSFKIQTSRGEYNCKAVIIAIGKTGNARTLDVSGGKLEKVFTRLIDPGEFDHSKILVVGGGDSAVEAAVALAGCGNEVSFSYRKEKLTRPKEYNLLKFDKMVNKGSIKPYFNSEVSKIDENMVVISTPTGDISLENERVFALLGSEIPVKFFQRAGIKLSGYKNMIWYINFMALLSFFTMLYFGKSGFGRNVLNGNGLLENIIKYFAVPFQGDYLFSMGAWYSTCSFLIGWAGSLIFLLTGLLSLIYVFFNLKKYFSSKWKAFKTVYFISVSIFFTVIYFRNQLQIQTSWSESPTYWYSFLYCLTMLIFGIRRIYKTRTKYVIYQTLTLISIQIFFLFLLPFYLYDSVIATNFGKDSYMISEIFPQGKWSSFGLILFWPLNINNFGTSSFWTWFPFIQTFGILLYIVLKWGKGAYCGWICSCGGMAETLGDEYRKKAPHGLTAKKLENIGQVILWLAFLATFIKFTGVFSSTVKDDIWYLYKFMIDIVFAGVMGLGVYFFYSGRIWCRYGCPLAALMHIYTKFSHYRIVSDKKRCISCNICTTVCHMGIDVMNYANKGIPMNDVECVRCSSCIVSCPMQVLTFGKSLWNDLNNNSYVESNIPLKKGWQSGLSDSNIRMRIKEEKEKYPERYK